ncbi:MAG: hypothetical protein ACJ0BW_02310 [Pontiellaceae bacterium]
MDELIPFLIFVAFTVFEIFKKKRKKKSIPPIQKSVETIPTEQSFSPTDEILKDLFSFNEEVTEEEIISNVDPIIVPKESEELAYQPTTINIDEASIVKEQTKHIGAAIQAAPSTLLSLKTLQIPSVPLISSNKNKSLKFPIKNKKVFKQSIIANIIFKAPRAYDTSFDNCDIS